MKTLPPDQQTTLIQLLKTRFEKNARRHSGMDWADVLARLEVRPQKLWSLQQMEETGGEPDVIWRDVATGEYLFVDCSPESPKGRRSLCYDRAAWESRKEYKPEDNAVDAAEAMGISTTRYKVLAFVISAALAGVAGGLSGQLFANPLNPQNLNFVRSIEIIVMIVIGGIGSITGAVFGATTLTVLPEALRTLDQQFPGLRMVAYALLLILMMIFRPQGLFGRREFGWAWLRRRQDRPAAAIK